MVKSVKEYINAIKNNPTDQDNYLNLATLYGQKQEWILALHYYAELININPKHEVGLLNFAIVATELDDWIKVYKSLTALLKITKNKKFKLKAHILIAQALKELGDKNLAMEHFESVLNIDNTQIEVQYHLGLLYLENKNLNKAEELLRNLELSGNNLEELYFNLAVLYHKKRDYKQAELYYEKSIKLSTSFNAVYNLASIYQKQNQLEKALEYYKKAQNINPNDQNIIFLIASLSGNNNNCKMPQEFVSKLFDSYADHFDQELCEFLDYKTPQKLYEFFIAKTRTLDEHITEKIDILDLGCGTGLSGAPFVHIKNKMIGIDLSKNMLTKANEKNIYDKLVCSEILEFLSYSQEQKLEETFPIELRANTMVILACDTLVYFNDLLPFFSLSLDCFKRYYYDNGIILFSVELSESQDIVLTKNCRYMHSKAYLEKIAANLNLKIITQETIIRYNAGQPVNGLLCIMIMV